MIDMNKVKHWRVYCETESAWTDGYLLDGVSPTTCFTDTGHTVNSNSTQLLGDIMNQNVNIVEESTPTGGAYKSVSYKEVCAVGLSTHDYSFKYPISALSISFNTIQDNQDDTLEVIIGEETTVGTVSATVTAADTVITVDSTVMDNAKLGYYINLDDATNNDNVGEVTSKDLVNSTITVDIPTTNGFAVGTLVKMSVKSVDNFTFGPPGRYVLGDSKIGGSYIPALTVIRVKYTNNGASSVNFYPVIEYLY